jgi:hypothetical protein
MDTAAACAVDTDAAVQGTLLTVTAASLLRRSSCTDLVKNSTAFGALSYTVIDASLHCTSCAQEIAAVVVVVVRNYESRAIRLHLEAHMRATMHITQY